MRSLTVLWLFPLLLCGGCSLIKNSNLQKEEFITAYTTGNQEETQKELEYFLKNTAGSGDELMWSLEAALVCFNKGEFTQSLEHFDRAEVLINEYDERAVVSAKDVGSEAAMSVTNLNALPYRGFCRDRIMLSIYKALTYAALNRSDAFRAQMRCMRDVQEDIRTRYAKVLEAEEAVAQAQPGNDSHYAQRADSIKGDIFNSNQNQEFNDAVAEAKAVASRGYGNYFNPLAVYFSGISFLRDGNYENARLDFLELLKAHPKDPFIQSICAAVILRSGRELPPELQSIKPLEDELSQDNVYVIFANGRGAAFRQIAIYFPIMVAWPVCKYFPENDNCMEISADGKVYQTRLMADMDGIISQEYTNLLPGMITRIVISTLIKEAGSYAATHAAAKQNALAGIGVLAATTTYRALMNTADTRSWETLPKNFQIAQMKIPADRKIKLRLKDKEFHFKIGEDTRTAFIYVNAPSSDVANQHLFEFTD